MKNLRVLFVDDEPLLLQGLQRMLRPMRGEWDIEYVAGGEQALAAMAMRPFDVIVSDMRMPGMNGAELLNKVMKRHPKSIRLILSGHSDRELIMRCVGSTHQFIAKPCDVDVLKAVVRRAASLRNSIQSDSLETLAAHMTHIPSVPSLYIDIVEILQNEDVCVEDVGRLISRDMGMTAKILKLVNSAYFGLPRQMSSATEAASHLGLDTLKTLVLSIHAFAQFENIHLGGLSIAALWEHSLRVAAGAKVVAKEMGASSKMVDEAFVGGILHDVGKLILAANFPDRYQEVLYHMQDESLDACSAEKHVFGAEHGDLGGYLLGLWGLPVPVVDAIALHHKPQQSTLREFNPLTAVHISNAAQFNVTSKGPAVDWEYLDEIGLKRSLDEWRNVIRAEAF